MKISVIIPVYQVSDYVERCLKSVMHQTYKDIECIIVDDATKDDSIEKCERLIGEYNGPIRFKIFHHEVNRGLSAARNTGTDAASGDYLYYLDSDDEITPDCLEKLMRYVLEDNSLEMVQGRYVMKTGEKEVLGRSDEHRIESNADARYQYLHWRKLNYTVWNKLLKRSFVIDNQLYNREGIINEDLLWTFHLIKYLSRAQLCNDVTYYYHIRPNSIVSSTSSEKRGKNYIYVYDDIFHNLTPQKEKEELKGYMSTFCVVLASYIRYVPDLKPVLRLYQKLAKSHGCWSVYFTLSVVAFVSRFCNPINILLKLNKLRWKVS